MKTFATVVAFLLALPVLAKEKDPKTHHCTKDGAVTTIKKKLCVGEGGKWVLIPGKQSNPKPAAK
jgi:hypothetical protein